MLDLQISQGLIQAIVSGEARFVPIARPRIKLACSCPDGAYMCKYVVAVLYDAETPADEKPGKTIL